MAVAIVLLAADYTGYGAMLAVFGDRLKSIPVSSNKSMIGHTLTAAGAVEAVISFLTIAHGRIPPTINYVTPDPAIALDVAIYGRALDGTQWAGVLLMGAALWGLKHLFKPGYAYQKAGVMLSGLVPREALQQDLFCGASRKPGADKLMARAAQRARLPRRSA